MVQKLNTYVGKGKLRVRSVGGRGPTYSTNIFVGVGTMRTVFEAAPKSCKVA